MTTEPDESSSDGPSSEQHGSENTLAAADRPPIRSTRQKLMVAIGAIALFACLVMGAVLLVQRARENALQRSCEVRLKLVGLLLASYADSRGSLPPASITDANGKPVLSWRIHVAEFDYYDYDFPSEMDFSQPWDSPKNATFLAPLGEIFQCPSADNDQAGTTNYVAVVGPGTMWPESGSRKMADYTKAKSLHESKPPIWVVEWPGSDIHWTEPRDVTVDQFLDWFRSKSRRHDSYHRGCLLYLDTALDIHELPNDTDPKTVRKLLTVREAKNKPPQPVSSHDPNGGQP